MNRKTLTVFLMAAVVGALPVRSQDDASAPPPGVQLLDEQELDQITGPIALYPDPLIAQILPAATQPSQIAVAENYVESGGDPNAIPNLNWDDSVKAIAHYPDVLKMMAYDLSWVTQLGDAFVNQPADVMNSIQRRRSEAQELGNLQSNDDEDVESDDGQIEILPANPDQLYIPTYDPGVVFYQHYYGAPFITFGAGYPIGIWLNHDFDWRGHRVFVWDHSHPRPANWWHERPAARDRVIARAPEWHAPAVRVNRQPVVVNHFDRGYAPRVQPDVHVIPYHPGVTARPEATHVEAPHVEASHVQAPRVEAPRVQTSVSAFGNRSAVEARAASARGAESRGVSASAHVSVGGGGGAARPSSGGGGGGHPGGGGGGNGKR